MSWNQGVHQSKISYVQFGETFLETNLLPGSFRLWAQFFPCYGAEVPVSLLSVVSQELISATYCLSCCPFFFPRLGNEPTELHLQSQPVFIFWDSCWGTCPSPASAQIRDYRNTAPRLALHLFSLDNSTSSPFASNLSESSVSTLFFFFASRKSSLLL